MLPLYLIGHFQFCNFDLVISYHKINTHYLDIVRIIYFVYILLIVTNICTKYRRNTVFLTYFLKFLIFYTGHIRPE